MPARRPLWLLPLCLLALGAKPRPKPPDAEARISRVENGLLPRVLVDGTLAPEMRLADRMGHYRVPAVSVAVIENGEIAWSRSYGFADVAAPRPAKASTRFQAGEISTLVSSAGALSLVKDGKLTLDADVNRWLTSWKVPQGDFTVEKKVTLRRLLSHSGGFSVEWFDGYLSDGPIPSLLQVLDGDEPASSPPLRVEYVPGTRFRYSAGGYEVVQQLVADVAHAGFAAALEQRVLRPAGMASSSFEPLPPRKSTELYATGYQANGKPVEGGYRVYPEQAASGLWTTAEDLARFAIEVQRARHGQGKVLNEELAREYLTPGFSDHALGPRITGEGPTARFSHSGVSAGFESLLVAYLAEGRGAVVMTNAEGGLALAQEIVLGIAREYGWSDYEPRKALRLTPEALNALAGKYQLDEVDRPEGKLPAMECEAAVRDGRLFWAPKGLPERELFAEAPSRFFSLDGPGVTFDRDPAGKVTGVAVRNAQSERRGKRF